MSSTREGLQAWGSGRESDPYGSALPPAWLPAASSCSATASAVPRQRGCSLLAFVVPTDLAHILSSADTASTFTVGSLMIHMRKSVRIVHVTLMAGMCMARKQHVMHSTCCAASTKHAIQHNTTQPAEHNRTSVSSAQHSTAQHITAQHSTAQHSTAQHSTAQHSTAQHSTAQQEFNTDMQLPSQAKAESVPHSTAQHIDTPPGVNDVLSYFLTRLQRSNM